MIISASYRTDISACYPDWFINRLAAGWCCVANPYGGPPGRVDLIPEAVDAFVFWTRNLEPFTAALEAVTALGLPFSQTCSNLRIGRFEAGFLLHRGWFRDRRELVARACLSTD